MDQFANNTRNRKLKKRDDAEVESMGKEHYFEMVQVLVYVKQGMFVRFCIEDLLMYFDVCKSGKASIVPLSKFNN